MAGAFFYRAGVRTLLYLESHFGRYTPAITALRTAESWGAPALDTPKVTVTLKPSSLLYWILDRPNCTSVGFCATMGACSTAQKMLFTVLAASTLLCMVSGAKSKGGDKKEWIAALRSVPKPTISGKMKNYVKNFVRNDRETGEYTHLKYNCTVADDQYVNLDDSLFGVTNVTCEENKLHITTATPQGMSELGHALAHSPTGLVFGGRRRMCMDVLGRGEGYIYRSGSFP